MKTATYLAVLLAGCGAELGPADLVAARELVYDEAGTPAYAGQALVIGSCGYGAFCHGAATEERFGAPSGLDYDLRVADEVERPRLTADLERAFSHRYLIWEAVSSGAMPISGAAGDLVADGAPRYARADGTPLAGLETSEGRETLRNWLAAGLPIVERTDAQPGAGELGWIEERLPVEPLAPRWSDIYARMIVPRCASAGCHGAAREGALDLRGEAESLAALVDAPAAGVRCGPEGGALIVPGDPGASLLVGKLTGEACGLRMPMGGSRIDAESIEAIRAWIAAGARRD